MDKFDYYILILLKNKNTVRGQIIIGSTLEIITCHVLEFRIYTT